MNSKLLSVIILSVHLTGCATAEIETITIGDKEYTKDSNGALIMTEEDIKRSIQQSGAVYVNDNGSQPYIKLTDKEFSAAAADHRALYTMLDIEPKSEDEDGEVVTLVREGSLRDNLSRIMLEQGWNSLDYNATDFNISEPYVIKGPDLLSVVDEIASDYSIFYCIDEDSKIITFINR